MKTQGIFKKIILFVSVVVTQQAYAQEERWLKAPNPQWQGKKDTTVYWYSLDAEGKLALTTDNQKWVVASQPQWTDYEGKVYKISGADLMLSNDTGKTWVKSTNRFWRGSDGMWYGFDDNWTLWTGGSGNNPPLAVVGSTNPYGGTDAQSGVNVNGETKGISGNNASGNNTSIVTPNASNTQSQGTKSAAEFNNTAKPSGGNSQTLPPK